MMNIMLRVGALVLVLLSVVTVITAHDAEGEVYDPPQENRRYSPRNSDNEYIRHIHSMINAYRSDMLGGRLVIETNALIDTKYRTWKRNADLINSLLALPKGMNDAGR